MYQSHRKLCNKVSKFDTKEIRTLAHQFRDNLIPLDKFNKTNLPITELLDYLRDKGTIEFNILDDRELPREYAVSCPDNLEIKCRESVYNGALDGKPRDRFTLAHELGHVLIHRNTSPVFAHSQLASLHHCTEDAEWQANTFASELLVDSRQLSGIVSPKDIKQRFGVSLETAGYAYDKFKREGLL